MSPVEPQRLRIIHYPDPALRAPTREVDPTDPKVAQVARRMLELMHEAPGVGLAAPQVGLSWRLFVANSDPEHDPAHDRVFCNPLLRDPSRESDLAEEGCLSLPGINVEVRRPTRITIEATDLSGEPITLTSDALDARIWQHETDHLDATLIIDRMSPMDRMANRKALKELESQLQTR